MRLRRLHHLQLLHWTSLQHISSGLFHITEESKQPCISAATTSKFEGFWGWPSSVQEISGVDVSTITRAAFAVQPSM